MHFGFNNQFIKGVRTRPISQKFQKIIFYFPLISEVATLYEGVFRILNYFVDIRTVRFYPIR
jgi:hypothetical protein